MCVEDVYIYYVYFNIPFLYILLIVNFCIREPLVSNLQLLVGNPINMFIGA